MNYMTMPLSKAQAHVLKVSETVEVIAVYENDAALRKESGWYISRVFNRKSCYWEDKARPGYGVTYWIHRDKALSYGLDC